MWLRQSGARERGGGGAALPGLGVGWGWGGVPGRLVCEADAALKSIYRQTSSGDRVWWRRSESVTGRWL